MSLRIIPFEPRHATAFRDLNVAWLRKYFYVEEKDVVLLEDSEAQILAPGGFIFMAEYEGTIAGCCSLIKHTDRVFELGKMAVDPEYQGLRIGQELLRHTVDHARSRGWEKIILYSNTGLGPALHIYRKFGFKEIPMDAEIPYARSDIKMELIL